jgi:hypothetical protein
MAGQLAIRAPHLDGTEPIKVWFAAAWAVYVDFMLAARDGHMDAIDDAMNTLTEPNPDQAGADGPTMDTWGADAEAQAAQAQWMASMSGMGGGPAGGAL